MMFEVVIVVPESLLNSRHGHMLIFYGIIRFEYMWYLEFDVI